MSDIATDSPNELAPAGETAKGAHRPGDRVFALLVVLLGTLWLSVVTPWITQQRTLLQRDVFTIHLPYKAMTTKHVAEAGTVPYFAPEWGLGQPLRGNPNALPLYPGNLLYRALPFWSAFHLHFALHWLLAFVGCSCLARSLGQSAWGALFAALTFAAGGWMLSALTFYNLLAVVAWWPWLLVGLLRRDRFGIALAGGALGLSILAGEPLTLMLCLIPAGVVTIRRGLRQGALRLLVVGTLGALLAAPQLVAFLRSVGFTARSVLGSTSELYSFHPVRLVELLLPLPFGIPAELGVEGFLSGRLAEGTPFVYSLHFGVVAIALIALAWRRSRQLAWWFGLGVALAVFGDVLFATLARGGADLLRYPEKFLVWTALAGALLAGRGLDLLLEQRRSRSRWLIGGALLLLLLAPLALGIAPLLHWLAAGGPDSAARATVLAQQWSWSLLLGAALLLLAALCARRVPQRRHLAAVLVLLQALALIRLAPLLQTDLAAGYRQPAPWAAVVGEGASVVSSTYERTLGTAEQIYYSAETTQRLLRRVAHLDLDYPTGLLYGLEYPLGADLESLVSPYLVEVLRRLPTLPWTAKLQWLRVFGVDYLVGPESEVRPGFEPLAVTERFGASTVLYAVEGGATAVWWPAVVRANSSPPEAFAHVSGGDDPVAVVTAPYAGEHVAGAEIRVLRLEADTLEVEVEGEGGLLVFRRAYHPLLEARADSVALPTLPVNLVLLGVEVPPGRQRVVVAVDKRPDRWALVAAVAGWLLVLWLGVSGLHSSRRRSELKHPAHQPSDFAVPVDAER